MTRQHVDDLIKNTKVIHIDGNESPEDKLLAEDSLRREMISFYYDQFRHFDNPAAPFFQFMSRDAHLTMGIGGVVRMRMYYRFRWRHPLACVCAVSDSDTGESVCASPSRHHSCRNVHLLPGARTEQGVR